MKSALRGRLHRVALGVGILILAIGISFFVWPLRENLGIDSVLNASDGWPVGGYGSSLITAGDVALSDSAGLDAKTAEPSARHGGPGDVANVQDRAELVVRDAEGNVKYQDTVR